MSDKDPDWLEPRGERWRITSAKPIHDNPWFAATAYAATAPTGVDASYYMLGFKNWAVGVIPLHEDGTITLIGQWRFPFGAYSWELPEGGQPLALEPMDGARRELAEEAGLEAAELRLILKCSCPTPPATSRPSSISPPDSAPFPSSLTRPRIWP